MRRITDYGPSLIVLATAGAVLLLGPFVARELAHRKTEKQIELARAHLEGSSVLEEMNQAYRAIALMVEPSVVHISAVQRGPNGGSAVSTGSGWVYDAEGHIVTNHHVVADAEEDLTPIDVQLSDGRILSAIVVGSDPATDIAVIKVNDDRLHPALRGDPMEEVEQGDKVFAFGSPFDFRFSMSSGIVSGMHRHVGVIGANSYESFIQVDAAINPGNSGGPLTDVNGRVVGMNTAIATGSNRNGSLDSGQFAGIGLAIPLNMIEPVVTQIIERGFVMKGFLGVVVQEPTPEQRGRIGLDSEGMVIAKIEPGSPAANAGLRLFDVVLDIDGNRVPSRQRVRSLISSMLPGDVARVRVLRPSVDIDGLVTTTELTIDVTLGRLPILITQGKLPPDQSESEIVELGIAAMATATPALAREHGVAFHEGVLVTELVADSPLATSLPARSTIVEVDGRPVATTREFIDALSRFDLRYWTAPRRTGRVPITVHSPRNDRLETHFIGYPVDR